MMRPATAGARLPPGPRLLLALSSGLSIVPVRSLHAAAECELPDRTFDMKIETCHPGEQIDVIGPDRAPTEAHVGGSHIERLDQHAHVLQDQRVGERAVFPRNPTEPGGD